MDPFVAREWSAPATGSADIGWDRRPKPHRSQPPPPPRHRAHVPGRDRPQHRRPRMPASLADQAARVAAANIQDIDPSHLHGLSPRALQLLLKHLDLESISLSTWKALQELGRAGHLDTTKKLALHQFLHHVKEPTADLSIYLAPLQSPGFTFISHLRLAGSCLIKAEELLYLPRWSKNLGLLELLEPSDDGTPFPRLNDRVFKAWSLHDEPFPRLKGIGLSTHNSITEQCLQYLTQFPALIMLDITAGKQDWRRPKSLANALGWIYCNRAEAQRWYDDDDDEGDPDAVPEVRVTSHKSWMRLSLGLDTLDIGPPLVIAQNSSGNSECHGFKLHNLLDMPASKMLQQGDLIRELPWSSALASLTLGRDQKLIRSHRSSSSEERMFFWRYWQGGIRHPAPEKKAQGASQKTPSTGRSDKSAPAVIRSIKKRSASSISDALSHFEGR
ncbi:hypothetical protein LA080_012897 [Diaporthe eres]|uniref:F-box domain-containing protein n=1 Tax=Diaporthe vaccinii TaxID=105482 RepID=A0ABR4DPK6_9PEZI|nr:hypothetical protein LA080_012897 [Diaporthe eres]